jgi:hypothetical protein
MLLTLFGDAFSPREEYLILNVFKHAMEYEIAHIKSPQELKEADSIVPKMVLTYNRRKQGVEYLKNTLTGVLKEMMLKEYNFELKAQTVRALKLSAGEASFNSLVLVFFSTNRSTRRLLTIWRSSLARSPR